MFKVGMVIGLLAGNFIYQLMFKSNWSEAVDRSIFQCVAVVVYAVASILDDKTKW